MPTSPSRRPPGLSTAPGAPPQSRSASRHRTRHCQPTGQLAGGNEGPGKARFERGSVSTINTVRGPVSVESLGRTLMHEHVFTFHSDKFADYPWREEEQYVAAAIGKLRKLKEAGWETLVDLTVFGLGRNVARGARVAEAADFNIIAATGMYVAAEMPLYFRVHLKYDGPDFLENLYVREIEEGIGETGIRAGVIKAFTDHHGLTPDVEEILKSAARAQLRTGVPISTHTDAFAETGLIQQKVFRREGVDLTDVIIGHCGDTSDLAYLQRLMDAGSYIGMDRFGIESFQPFENRVQTVAALCRKGYASQMLLSHDANCGADLFEEQSLREWKWGFIHEKVVPRLRELGVPDADIDQMTIGNPAKIFARSAEGAK